MKYLNFSILIFILFIGFSCNQKPEVSLDVHSVALLPNPLSTIANSTSFVFNQNTEISLSSLEHLENTAHEFSNYIQETTSLKISTIVDSDTTGYNRIYLIVDPNLKLLQNDNSSNLEKEEYSLSINKDRVLLLASSPTGIYRGVQTLKQLLPLDGMTSSKWEGNVWALPGCEIIDAPRYAYRGAMLDVARHFFPVEDVKRYIDLLSLYKINKLHLHLSDDQGWRIEIKSWPKLTEIGGSTAVGGGKGGFYTQEDYVEIVNYALQKHITIIPEIDMPGHTNAALASYPKLNCDNKATKLYTGMRVGFSSLCVDKEITYTFLNDVIRELAAITPGSYIHLGGDESHVTSKDDYNKFLQRAFKIVKKYNKKVIGWEDIESAGVDDTFILQHWTSKEKADKGARQGAKIILSPAPYTYLDMKYNDSTKLGLTWAGTISIEKSYNWKPSKILEASFEDQIMGIESPLWSETVTTIKDIEYMAFPRIIVHASLGWEKNNVMDTSLYVDKLNKNLQWFDRYDVNYKK